LGELVPVGVGDGTTEKAVGRFVFAPSDSFSLGRIVSSQYKTLQTTERRQPIVIARSSGGSTLGPGGTAPQILPAPKFCQVI